jgi:hypothetical protein
MKLGIYSGLWFEAPPQNVISSTDGRFLKPKKSCDIVKKI